MKVIVFRHTFFGILAAALVMIPFYVGLWIVDIGGLGGVMNDDSYPVSIFLLPVVAALFSGVAFWIGVFPAACFARWIGNKRKISTWRAGVLAVGVSAFIGGVFGQLSGGLGAACWYALFLGSAAIAFWWTAARGINIEPLSTAYSTGG